MASDPQDNYVAIITANLQRTLDFLKFAEAKNAALLALASAWIGATLNLECSGKTLPAGFSVSVPIALLCALCAGVSAMLSLLPRLQLKKVLGGKRLELRQANLLYFGDISTLPMKILALELPTRYLSDGQGHRAEYIHDLTVQLSVNSKITIRKMRLFNYGMRFILLGSAVLLFPSLRLLLTAIRGLW